MGYGTAGTLESDRLLYIFTSISVYAGSDPSSEYEWEDANDCSLVFDLSYENLSVLTTGDLGMHGEENMTFSRKGYDILKVGHHGSKKFFYGRIFAKMPTALWFYLGRTKQPLWTPCERDITAAGGGFLPKLEYGTERCVVCRM